METKDEQTAERIVTGWALNDAGDPHAREALIGRIHSALTDARREPEWQPIETAPRDATPILVGLITGGKVWRVSDAKYYAVGFYTVHGGNSCHWATHWMHLPAPPKESNAK